MYDTDAYLYDVIVHNRMYYYLFNASDLYFNNQRKLMRMIYADDS